jgi:hypothetical protein
MSLPNSDEFTDLSEILGINLSDKNHIKSLWDLYCNKVEKPTISSSETDKLNERLITHSEEPQRYLTSDHVVSDILNTIRDEKKSQPTTTLKEQFDWIDEQITILSRLKGDLELSLRNASEDRAAQPNDPR